MLQQSVYGSKYICTDHVSYVGCIHKNDFCKHHVDHLFSCKCFRVTYAFELLQALHLQCRMRGCHVRTLSTKTSLLCLYNQLAIMTLDQDGRSSGKRGPSTPLTPHNMQNKRIVYSKPDSCKFDSSRIIEPLPLQSSSQLQLVDAKYKMWLLEKLLSKQREMTKFLELEREYAMEG